MKWANFYIEDEPNSENFKPRSAASKIPQYFQPMFAKVVPRSAVTESKLLYESRFAKVVFRSASETPILTKTHPTKEI